MRFPLYSDADMQGPLVEGLRARGWDVVRAVDVYPEGTQDRPHFEHAAREGRVLLSYDADQLLIALEWLRASRPFRGLITWKQRHHRRLNVGFFLEALEAIAAEDDPLAYPIRFINPPR